MSFFNKISSLGDGVKDALNIAANSVADTWDEHVPSIDEVAAAASSAAQKVSSAASVATGSIADAWDEHVPSMEEFGVAASSAVQKVSSAASDATASVADAWDKHAPSKETVVGALAVGGLGALALNKEELKAVGARTITAASKTASTVSDAAATAARVAKDNPGAAIIGGVIAVAAVAAAPFTGGGSVLAAATLAESLAGAGLIAAAVGTAGAASGVAISNAHTKKAESTAHNKGFEKGKAESAVKISELSKMVVHAAKAYSEQTRRDEFIISLAAIGFAMAACDGSISSEEKECIEECVLGVSKVAERQSIRDCLNKMAETPPNFEGAIVYIKKFDDKILPYVDSLLEVIGDPDRDINASEQDFLSKWDIFKSMAHKKGVLA
jgi:hypothetical protein